MPDRPHPVRGHADTARRLAIVTPQHGPAGLFGPSCEAAARLAAAELNRGGGMLGAPVELVFIDGADPPGEVAGNLRRAVRHGGVQAVTGWHISSVRRAIAPALAGAVPYVYPSLYEGGERHPGVVCLGEVPQAQVRPALRWLRGELGVRRWFIAGNDYVWPRATAAATRGFAPGERLEIVGDRFVALGCRPEEMAGLLDAVEASGCQGVLMLFAGQDGVEFNRAFARRELDRGIIRFSSLMEENMLLASGPQATEGLFAAAAYFRSLASAAALDFQGRYSAAYGPDAPALNAAAESTYAAVHVVAELAQRAGALSVGAIGAVLDRAVLQAPRGQVRFQGRTAVQDVYLALARGCDFDIVARL